MEEQHIRKDKMKLCRIGDLDKEKPAIIDKDNKYRDLSSIIDDFNPDIALVHNTWFKVSLGIFKA
mgnify:CR=1 FL=1